MSKDIRHSMNFTDGKGEGPQLASMVKARCGINEDGVERHRVHGCL